MLGYETSQLQVKYDFGPSDGKPTRLSALWKDYGVCIQESKLFLITKGQIAIRINGVETICSAGEMVLIPAGTKHDYYLPTSETAEKYWFHFTLNDRGRSFFDSLCLPLKVKTTIDATPYFIKACTFLTYETSPISQINAVLSIVELFLSCAHAQPVSREPNEIDTVIDYINEHFNDNLSLATLANLVHLSPNYLVRKFHSRTGVSPMQFTLSVRISQAKTLLSTTNLTVSAVMERVGFYDSAHFCKQFKSATGYSPRAFRALFKHY